VGCTSNVIGITNVMPTCMDPVGTMTPDRLPAPTDSPVTPMLLMAQAPSNAIPHRQEWRTPLPAPAPMGTHMGSQPSHLAALNQLFKLCFTTPCKCCPFPLQCHYHIQTHQIPWNSANFLSNYTLYRWLLALERLCQNTAWDRWQY